MVNSPPNLAPGAGAAPDDATVPSAATAVFGGRYAVEAELGRGGMGRVLRARDLRLDRPVAIKVLPAGAHTGEQRMRFEQEARAAGALNHPNVLDVHDAGEQDGEPYIVSELLEGDTLRAALSRGPLDKALDLAVQLARGLAAAHAKGIVHRDLKPENLFLTRDGRLKILDFGIARLPAGGGPRTETGAILGTPQYMSPEQVRGERADARSDVFALGSVAFEMLTGRAPFERATSAETGYAILHDAAPPLPKDAPPRLARTIERCLRKNPPDRYPDAGALLDDLIDEPPRRRRVWPWWAASAALVAAAAVAASLAPWRKTVVAAPPSVAVLPFVDLSPGRDQEYFSDGIAEEILDQLAHVQGLRVVGRTSSFSFKGKSLPLGEIGSALNAGAILEGSVGKDGGRVRVTARLTGAADGYEIWSEKYDRELSGIFATQDEIAGAVVRALRVKLAAGQSEEGRRTSSPEAYDQYLLGRRFLDRGSQESFARAQGAFERAVALDPKFAAAWAALARTLYEVGQGMEDSTRRRALESADKAIQLAPGLAEGWAARGYLRFALMTFDWDGARSDLDRAVALGPGDAGILSQRASLLSALGRLEEARADALRATGLDPLSADAWYRLGVMEYGAGRLQAANLAFQRSREISPEHDRAEQRLWLIALLEGRPADVLAAINNQSRPRFFLRAMAYHSLGRDAEARQALEVFEAGPTADRGAWQLGFAWAWLGDRDQSFHWLERALEVKDPGLVFAVKTSPFLRNIRSDPRYAALLRKMNLPAD